MSDLPEFDAEKLEENLGKVQELTNRLVIALSDRKPHDKGLDGPDQQLYMKAAAAYMAEMMANPAKMIEAQVGYWGETLRNFADAQKVLETPEEQRTDRRFKNDLWGNNPYFNMIRKQYELNATTLDKATEKLDHLPQSEQRRVNYFAKQYLDMVSPTNFLASNPDALEKAMETNGESLVKGLENFVRDLEANQDGVAVTLSDPDAFTLGENIATTEGAVVFQNRMFQLIQYKAKTDEVYKTPLLIFPPWINKFYILDLKKENSLIRYAVERGHTVFVVSWINPDGAHRDVGLNTYFEEGFCTAIDQVKAITGEPQVDVVGYCIAGTLTTMSLAHFAKTGRDDVKSATFFTTMTDFEDPGELGAFIEDGFLKGLTAEVGVRGYLDSFFMSQTFSFLRANDLVYAPAVRSYMMGEAPPAFDLLHWNGDGTNLPGRMAVEYLEQLYRDNKLAKGEFHLAGQNLNMADIKVPMFIVATQTDHIAPWKSSFKGLSKTSGEKTYILSQSGHIAGIVNPTPRNKYGHWMNTDEFTDPETWVDGAEFFPESWWPRWTDWLERYKRELVPARELGGKGNPVLESAPGSYVMKRHK